MEKTPSISKNQLGITPEIRGAKMPPIRPNKLQKAKATPFTCVGKSYTLHTNMTLKLELIPNLPRSTKI